MSHEPHEGKGIILFDSCEECVSRAARIDGLFELDALNLNKLARLATQQRIDQLNAGIRRAAGVQVPPGSSDDNPDLSHADRKAIENLRAAGRLTFRSGISPEACE